jgi:hypothetical protein
MTGLELRLLVGFDAEPEYLPRSEWDMQQIFLDGLIRALMPVDRPGFAFAADPHGEISAEEAWQTIEGPLGKLEAFAVACQWPVTLRRITTLRGRIPREGTLSRHNVSNELLAITDTLEAELSTHIFWRTSVLGEKILQTSREDALGDEATARYPDLIEEVGHAMKSVSLGLGTAAVFHAMRILEVGVVDLLAFIGKPLTKRDKWGLLLSDLKQYSDNEPDAEKAKFVRELHNYLHAAKEAWRNDTIHDYRVNFHPNDAYHILFNVLAFMRSLAIGLGKYQQQPTP